MSRMEIDHLFMFIEPGGPEIDALLRLGLTETYRRAHPGQGTANVCFAFDNLYLELLWLTSEAEARSPAIARTRLWERSQWRTLGTCPLGIAVRGDLASAGVPTWDYRPPYLPLDMSIPVATDSDDPMQPMLFVSPGREAPLGWPESRRSALQSAAGFGPVLSVELALPGGAASAPLHSLVVPGNALGFAARPDGRFGLRLLLGDRSEKRSHVLDIVSTDDGPWEVSLNEETLH
ncbi:VOC family protein [Hydrogenophaga sp. ZJX-1]|uniref:VOC family protein n=1 Tax=Hydrogenophaga sp. ZJX-1 TaxID=3404778 RepID=UPI003B28267B